MKRSLSAFTFLCFLTGAGWSQSSFLVSCPGEIKMEGIQHYFFYTQSCFLIYNANASELKVVINLNDLHEYDKSGLPGQEIEYNANIEDSNSFIFKGSVPEKTIRPMGQLNDTYTFSING